MATRFVNVDRATPLSFPPDLRDWVREQEQQEYEAQVAVREEKRERGEVVKGHVPQPPSEEPEAKTQINFADPESRIMKSRNGFAQVSMHKSRWRRAPF